MTDIVDRAFISLKLYCCVGLILSVSSANCRIVRITNLRFQTPIGKPEITSDTLHRSGGANMPRNQSILEMEFDDSEPDSEDEIDENEPQQEVQLGPQRKKSKLLGLVEIGSVLTAAAMGVSNRSIGRQMGVGESTIRGIRARFLTRGNCIRKVGSGRKPKCTAHDTRAIMKEVRNNPFVSAPEVRLSAGVEHVSVDTVLRVVHASGEFNSYWAARKPFISAVNVQRRVEWCNRYKDWKAEDWRKVLWSDESPFTLRYKGSQRVWRGVNQRYNPRYCIGTLKHDVKINVWGGFGNGKVGSVPE